ncbi:hypothetical protein H1C71_041904, partial [Ictidomys tridecemlineatus]
GCCWIQWTMTPGLPWGFPSPLGGGSEHLFQCCPKAECAPVRTPFPTSSGHSSEPSAVRSTGSSNPAWGSLALPSHDFYLNSAKEPLGILSLFLLFFLSPPLSFPPTLLPCGHFCFASYQLSYTPSPCLFF